MPKIDLHQAVKISRKEALTHLIVEAIRNKKPWTVVASSYMFYESNVIEVALSNKSRYKITITEIK